MSAVRLQDPVQGRLGPYLLLGQLSAGGMGVVYRARHEETGALVALKTVKVPEAALLRGIRREIHALRRIQHPGVVRVLAEGVHDGLPWYAMELLEGLTLRRYIDLLWKRDQAATEVATQAVSAPMPDEVTGVDATFRAYRPPEPAQRRAAAQERLGEVLTLTRRLCASLAFLHGEGLVHRDLKPENIVLRPDGTPVLVDFGLAANFGGPMGRESLDVSGSMEGSYVYMAPEQIKGALVDARSDLYSLGCILHELVVGQPPFPGAGWDVLRRHLRDTPHGLSEWVTGVAPELDALVTRMLAKVPRERIGYAADVGAVLARLGAEEPRVEGAASPRPYLYRPGFVGRHELIEELEALLDRAKDGQGGCLLLGGESGAGKTRVVMEGAVIAARRAFRVVTGGSQPLSGGRHAGEQRFGEPLHAFKPFLQAVADECRHKGAHETEHLLGARGPVLAVYEESLRDLPGQETWPEPPRLSPVSARERLLRCLAETLAAFCDREPALLVMDDLQWADELSLSALDFLRQGLLGDMRLLVVGTYRTEELDAALRPLVQAPGVEHRTLGRMDAPVVARMVEDMLALASPPASFVHFLTTRSAGNPFFVAEYLRTAIDERLLYRDVLGRWQVAAGDHTLERLHEALPLPGVLHDLVGRRLEGLGAEARALLEVAAVLGRELDGDVLAGAAGLGDLQELEALEELRARHVLEDAGGGRLRFVHDKLRETAYDGIPAARRRALHRDVALALEAQDVWGGVSPALYPVLAHHWEHAQDDVWTFEYLEKAGAHALAAGSNLEASGYLRRALALEIQRGQARGVRLGADRRARWQRMLAEAMHGLSDFDASIAHAQHALAELGRPLPVTDGGWKRFLVAQTARQVLHLLVPRAWRSQADRQVREGFGAASLAAMRLAECYYWRYDPFRMTATALLSTNLAERAGSDEKVLRLYGQLGSIAGFGGLDSLARAYFRRGQGEGEKVKDPSAAAFGLIVESMYQASFARWGQAALKAEEAQRVLVRLGDKGEQELSEVLLGHVDYFTGHFESSLERFTRVLESARKRGHFQHEVWSLYTLARSLLALGRGDEAMPLLRESAERLKDKHDPLSHIITHGLLSTVYRERGEWEWARDAADRVMALARRFPPMLFTEGQGYEGAASTYLALWERERVPGAPPPAVAEEAREACARLAAFARRFTLARPMALRFRGRLLGLSGHPWRARRAFKRGVKLAQALGLPYEEALGGWELGRVASGAEREAALTRAHEGFLRLGCVELARRVGALRASGTPRAN
jgi:eukaryotic-like serine/threonine-protein kinase